MPHLDAPLARGISSNGGAAWLNAEGWLTIKLNAGVRLAWDDDLHIGLFPVERAGRQVETDRDGGEEPPPF
jgi:hypothetical protein